MEGCAILIVKEVKMKQKSTYSIPVKRDMWLELRDIKEKTGQTIIFQVNKAIDEHVKKFNAKSRQV